MFYMYVLKNIKTGKLYLGFTNDLRRRIEEHKAKNPELLYYEAYKSKLDAQNREKKLKQRGQSIRWLKSRIKHSLET